MNVTKHVRERWVERFRKENHNAIPGNIEEIDKEIIEYFNRCEYLFDDERSSKSSVYINPERDWIFIVDRKNHDTLITCYEIDYGFPPHINRQITEELLKLAEEARQKAECAKETYEQTKQDCDQRRDIIDEQINALKAKLEALEHERNKVNEEEKIAEKELNKAESEFKSLTYQITYSKNYRLQKLVS